MKLVTAIIRPHKLEHVRQTLLVLGVEGINVSESKGFGHQKGHSEVYRGRNYAAEFVPRVRIELAVKAEQVTKVVEAIMAAAHTGHVGDGKVMVTELEQVYRIRTGESGDEAI